MDLVRRHGGGGAVLQRQGVVGLALRQAPAAGVVRRLGPPALDQGDLARQGRLDLGGEDRGGLGLPVAGQVLFLGSPRQGGDQARGVGRHVVQAAHLRQGLVDDEVGRDDALASVAAGQLGFLVEHGGEGLQPRQIGLGVLPRLDGVLVVQESRHALVGSGELGEHIRGADAAAAVGDQAVRVGALAVDEGQGVVAHPRGGTEGGAVDALEGGQSRGVVGRVLGHRSDRTVGQFGAQPHQISRVQAKSRGFFGRSDQVAMGEVVHHPVEGRIAGRSGQNPKRGDTRGDTDGGGAQ